MPNIRVDLDYTIRDGSEIKFRSPVDCSAITGLIVYYPGADGNTTSKEFAFADAHGNNVGDIDHLFAENVVVKVILDVTHAMAFVQNADTNAYIERTFIKTVNGVSPDENGNVVVEGGNGTGGVAVETDPTVPAWAKQPNKPTYTASEVGALPNTYTPPNQTAEQVGADSKGTAASAVSQHNTANDSHGDIRLELKAINDRLTAFFDSDNQTLDELSEIVAYITSNKSLIDSITTSKVSVADIINNLTTNVSNKPLSAAQGVALKALIDAITVPTKLSQLTNDKGYITGYTETDPTVPAWAKNATKPSYSKSEVGLGNVDNVKQYSASNPPPYPVTSVNGKTGAVNLDASAVGARPSTWMPSASDVGALPASTTIPTKVSQLTNDKGYLTQHQDISGKVDKDKLALGRDENGLLYLYIDGVPVGAGVELPTGGIDGYITPDKQIIFNNLPDGEYTLAYINDDGSIVPIGAMEKDTNVYYTITNTLTQCTTNNSATKAVQGGSYSATITAKSGYELKSIVVKMGGTDISSTAVSGSKITISNVTGNIVITAVATEVATTPKGNLADPTSADWLENTRLATAYGTGKTLEGSTFTNFIPAKAGDVLRVKGLDLLSVIDNTFGTVAFYKGDKTYQSYTVTGIGNGASPGYGAKNKLSVSGDIQTYTIALIDDGTQKATSETGYIRISCALMDGYTKDDVVITINEEITDSGNGGNETTYTNLLPLAVDVSGNDYVGTNGEDGYKYGYRISRSSGNETSTPDDTIYCTGFMPVTRTDTIRIDGVAKSSNDSNNNIVYYDSTKKYIGGVTLFGLNSTVDADGRGVTTSPSSSQTSTSIAFFRFSAGSITDDTIVTVTSA